MRIVLPPSETKTTGGRDESHLEWDQLALPELTSVRQAIAEDLVALSLDPEPAKKALGLGVKGDDWVVANRELLMSPVMPAIHRYTGVLFDDGVAVAVLGALWTASGDGSDSPLPAVL
jgi:cytoplasmic iron level regulating protein YaaA (DUF328/UPF0246 family)